MGAPGVGCACLDLVCATAHRPITHSAHACAYPGRVFGHRYSSRIKVPSDQRSTTAPRRR